MNNLLLDEQPLIVLPKLAEKVGLNESIFLQQIHYWVKKKLNKKDGRYWVYNTYDNWKEQFPFWSTSTIRRTLTSLENKKLVIVGNYNKAGFDKTKWYTIDYTVMNSMSRPSVHNEQTCCSKWADAPVHNEQTNTRELPETNSRESSSKENPFNFYEKNIGMINPFVAENINYWIELLSEELVIEAMKKSLLANKKNFNYAEGILKNWKSKNVKTVSDAAALEKEFKGKGKSVKSGKNDIDWKNL